MNVLAKMGETGLLIIPLIEFLGFFLWSLTRHISWLLYTIEICQQRIVCASGRSVPFIDISCKLMRIRCDCLLFAVCVCVCLSVCVYVKWKSAVWTFKRWIRPQSSFAIFRIFNTDEAQEPFSRRNAICTVLAKQSAKRCSGRPDNFP